MTALRALSEQLRTRLDSCQPGQGLLEYGLILVVCSLAAVVLIMSMGPKVASMFSGAAASLQ
jgi:Flp pilus assembly pilin Flp